MSVMGRYTIMWLFAMFDLPTNTALERKQATVFRNDLLNLGFLMHQYSIYIKRCMSREKVDTIVAKIESKIPKQGQVHLIWVTDKQFMDSIHVAEGFSAKKPPEKEDNLLIF